MAKTPSLNASILTVSFRSKVFEIVIVFSGVSSFGLATLSALTI
jgi:hypothetical protein